MCRERLKGPAEVQPEETEEGERKLRGLVEAP
jgi:hypothetical protein